MPGETVALAVARLPGQRPQGVRVRQAKATTAAATTTEALMATLAVVVVLGLPERS
jgi:hypothetical protein